ncbi:DUF4259 domain-containing protein [Actinoplanes sp. NBRC 101535]|uniref:DUF4259 domain-containing protein n=1 Tax=Actinoplanes sp. NBRC 101535 TaxID=3032196 RepID=UPI0024A27B8C|nr:DUF4259 domain-containing protein [Actinoplanes sp. NBRC 101535]GLY05008.1 hypothetical protein Acsp01_53870 [Actinoplanes sp. NBRC 101535]
MATWNVGPFDNDEAVEWCDRFHLTPPDQRSVFVETTLADAVAISAGLTSATCSEAVAAATVVLQTTAIGFVPATPYATVSPIDPIGITATPRLISLARGALQAIMTEESAFRHKWSGDIEEDLALETIQRLQRGLASQ